MIHVSPYVNPRQYLRGLQSDVDQISAALFECCIYDTVQMRSDHYIDAMHALNKASDAIGRLRATASPDTFDKLSIDCAVPDSIIKRI